MTEEITLDKALAVFANYDDSYEPGYEEGVMKRIAETKQATLDWHNKQVEEVLDRLENKVFAIKQDIEVSQYPAKSVYEPEVVSAHHKVIPVSAIEAERAKLKGDE